MPILEYLALQAGLSSPEAGEVIWRAVDSMTCSVRAANLSQPVCDKLRPPEVQFFFFFFGKKNTVDFYTKIFDG